jgi:hypothetical protein
LLDFREVGFGADFAEADDVRIVFEQDAQDSGFFRIGLWLVGGFALLGLGCVEEEGPRVVDVEVEGGAGVPEFNVPATGGWQSYRTVEVGRVELPMGSHRAVLRALSKPGEAVANIRAVRLVRVR